MTGDGASPGRWVGHCTCATWDSRHELGCGWDVDESAPVPTPSGPVAAMPYAGVPTSPAHRQRLLVEGVTHADLVALTGWMAEVAGFDAADLADAVARPWKWETELAEARDWAWLQAHTHREDNDMKNRLQRSAEYSQKIAKLEREDPEISKLSDEIHAAADRGDFAAEDAANGRFNDAVTRKLGELR